MRIICIRYDGWMYGWAKNGITIEFNLIKFYLIITFLPLD